MPQASVAAPVVPVVPPVEVTALVNTLTAPPPMAITPPPPAPVIGPLIRSAVEVPMLTVPVPLVDAKIAAPAVPAMVLAVVDSMVMPPEPLVPVLVA